MDERQRIRNVANAAWLLFLAMMSYGARDEGRRDNVLPQRRAWCLQACTMKPGKSNGAN